MANDLRDKGIAIANEAVQSDNAGNYEDAIIKYCKAAEYLLTAIKYENNPVMLKKIREKCTEYTSRAETLKKLRREAEERERAPIMVEATVVVPQAQPVVPMGLPVTTSESSSSGKRTIAEMAKICESQLGVSGNVMSVINQAAEQLNVKTGDRPLVEVAEECMRVMGY